MTKFFLHFTCLGILALSSPSAMAAMRIVSTIPDLAALAKIIGGSAVEVSSIVRATQDPHFVDAKPSFMLELNRADLLLLVGLDLEIGWLPPLLTGARNPKIAKGSTGYLDCAQFIRPMEVQSADRSKGDIHPGGNPHYWLDPRNLSFLANGIAERMGAIDPANSAGFKAAADRFATQLKEKISAWRATLQPLAGAKVIVYHRSWAYFLDFAGLQEVGALEPKPGIPPSPTHIAGLVGTALQQKVKFVLQESYFPTNLSALFCEKAKAELKVLPTMTGAMGSSTPLELIDALVRGLTISGGVK